MAINDPQPPIPTRLTPLDEAVILYHQFGEDFIAVLDQYISCFPEAKRYVFFGPGYILMGHEETRDNPHDTDTKTTDPYWYVTYASGRIQDMIHLMPYELDRVGFARYAKYPERGVRFIPTATLKRLNQRNHGIKT